MPFIIGITGLKGAGKSTVAAIIHRKYSFPEYTFAGPLKYLCQIAFLLEQRQLHDPVLKEQVDPRWGLSPRQMMQTLGTECFRGHFGPDYWLKLLKERLATESTPFVIVSDVRFENEADFVKQQGGIVVRVERAAATTIDAHITEAGQADIQADIVVQNDSTVQALEQQVSGLMTTIFETVRESTK